MSALNGCKVINNINNGSCARHGSGHCTMKRFVLIISVICISMNAFAQNPFVFGFLGLSYSPVSVVSNGDSFDMHGITLGGNVYRNITDNLYMDIDPINIQVIFSSSNDYGFKTSTFMMAMKPSLGLAYRINLNDDDIFFLPNAGFNIGAYLGGSSSVNNDSSDLFKDMGYNRFIFDWHAGINLCMPNLI